MKKRVFEISFSTGNSEYYNILRFVRNSIYIPHESVRYNMIRKFRIFAELRVQFYTWV